MKKLFILAALSVAAIFSSCEYDDDDIWDSVHGLEDRVARLEELCKQMNTNISSLQTIVTALQNNDYVTGVTPVTNGGETIGYTITFSKSSSITIYHGKDGADGANGQNGKDGLNGADGHTPIIGVRQDTDGIYYWTIDGDWLLDNSGNKVKAEGRDGKDGQDGVDGQPGSDGQDGADGKDGKDGIAPQLKIENGYWFVSTDNGTTWTNLGKVTGEDGKDGADGTNGKDGDSIFQNVTQDADNVYFTLAGGEVITLPKKPRLAIAFAEGTSLTFDVDETQTVNYTISGGGSNNVVKAEMLNNDGAYTLYTASTSATTGSIRITAKTPTTNRVIVSVSDGTHTIMAAIDVLRKPFDGKTVIVTTPGTLASLLADYDKTAITELTVIGNLNDSDIATLKALPNLAMLDMEQVNLEELKSYAFSGKTSLTSIVLPRTLKTIGAWAFSDCSNLTGNLVIPEGVTTIEESTFAYCSGLTGNLVIPESVTEIGYYAFSGCSGLTSVYCKAQTPPSLGPGAFTDWAPFTLYVPTGCKEAYAAANGWKSAKEIIEMEF